MYSGFLTVFTLRGRIITHHLLPGCRHPFRFIPLLSCLKNLSRVWLEVLQIEIVIVNSGQTNSRQSDMYARTSPKISAVFCSRPPLLYPMRLSDHHANQILMNQATYLF